MEVIPCKLRITELNSDEESLVMLCKKYSNPETLIIVKEHQPYLHYHLYLELNVSKPTWLDRLQKIVGKGNKAYSQSFKHHNWDVYRGYLYKHEDTEIIYQHQNDVHNIPHYIQEYNKHNKGSAKNFKNREHTLMLEAILEKLPDEPTHHNIGKAVMEFYCENNKPFHKANMVQLIHLVNQQLNPHCPYFLNMLLSEAFPEHISLMESEIRELKKINKQYRQHFQNDTNPQIQTNIVLGAPPLGGDERGG